MDQRRGDGHAGEQGRQAGHNLREGEKWRGEGEIGLFYDKEEEACLIYVGIYIIYIRLTRKGAWMLFGPEEEEEGECVLQTLKVEFHSNEADSGSHGFLQQSKGFRNHLKLSIL